MPCTGASARAIDPDTVADGLIANNNCSLREAVEAANTNAAVDKCPAGQAAKLDVIHLAAATYGLGGAHNEDANQTGDLDILDGGPLRFTGRGRTATSITSITDHIIDLVGDGPLTIERLKLTGGKTEEYGGELRLDGGIESRTVVNRVRLTGGRAQFGGAIYAGSGELQIRHSTLDENRATVNSTGFPSVIAYGGAAYLRYTDARISDSRIVDNVAEANDSSAFGGAFSLATGGKLDIVRSEVADNRVTVANPVPAASQIGGGAIRSQGNSATTVNLLNSTISQNELDAPAATAAGSALLIDSGTSTIRGTTIYASAFLDEQGSTIAVSGGTVAVGASILSGRKSDLCVTSGTGELKTLGYSVAPVDCGFLGARDRIAKPFTIANTFGDNGGESRTFSLQPSSPATNLVPRPSCKKLGKSDQRGAERPFGKRCDAGAYERTLCRNVLVLNEFRFGTAGRDVFRGTKKFDGFAPSAGRDRLQGRGGGDLICGGSGRDLLVGGAGPDRLAGGGGRDVIRGGTGPDKLSGGPGRDKCVGGPGHDTATGCEIKVSIP